jgi:fructose-bisphosphate aldolase class 1
MTAQALIDTARMLVAGDKGLLAMDESNPPPNKRFAKLGIPQTKEARRAYRELIVTTPGLGECISGVILYEETIRQQKIDGTSFVKALTDAGIIPGIQVDTGAKDLAGHPGEKITEGLDGLHSARLNAMNVRFKSRLPWALAFSFARAIQQPALEIWRDKEANVVAAQRALVHRARCNRAAHRGPCRAEMENDANVRAK